LAGERTFLTSAWRHLVLLTLEVEARVLLPRLPAGLELDLHEGRALVSLVGFQFLETRVLGVPLPFLQRFEEVNLRFYVRREAPEGPRRGVVFVKEVVPRWPIAAGARWFFNEPYRTMPMRHRTDLEEGTPRPGGTFAYEWKAAGRWNRLAAQVGAPLGLAAPDSGPEFVVERYWGYTRQRDGSTVEYRVRHPPWRLWAGLAPALEVDFEGLYGLNALGPRTGEPWSALIADGSAVTVSRGTRVD
jgi:uncharacterized protein YqjF (DUF2071 family)